MQHPDSWGHKADRLVRRWSVSSRVALPVAAALVWPVALHGQTNVLPLDAGELVATCHSGYPYNANDPNGFVVVAFDARDPAGNGAVLDVNWLPPFFHNEIAPTTAGDVWNVRNLGQVFGIALDGEDAPNIYVTASTVYGAFIDAGGTDLTFGPAGGGGVYRLDGLNGDISIWASLPNTGPGLGQICFDERNNQFFVSNFEDGLIYRLDASIANTTLSTFDHGVNGRPNEGLPVIQDDPMVAFTQFGRRIWGVGMHRDRLYYAVWNEDLGCHPFFMTNPNYNPNRNCLDPLLVDNEIWSVQIDSTTGDFIPSTAQRELSLPGLDDGPAGWPDNEVSNPVSDIAFTSMGKMILAERSRLDDVGRGRIPNHPGSPWDAHRSRVLEATGSVGAWTLAPDDTYRVGWVCTGASTQKSWNSAGGIAPDCEENVWSSGDAIHFNCPSADGRYLYGLQRIPTGGNQAASPRATTPCYLIDIDGVTNPGPGYRVNKSQVGDVEIYDPGCTCLLIDNIDVLCPQEADGAFTISFDVTNQSGLDAEWIFITPQGGFNVSPNTINIPTLGDGMTTSVSFSVTGAMGGDQICFLFTLLTEDLEECCTEEVCIDLPECDCLQVLDFAVECDPANPGKYLYTATIQNLSMDPIYHLYFVYPNGESSMPNYLDFSSSPIPPFGTTTIATTICDATPGSKLTFRLSIHSEIFEECCSEIICVDLPPCDDGDPSMDYCLSTQIVPCCPQSLTGTIVLQICNTSGGPRTYNWTAAGLPPDSSCIVTLPAFAFAPPNGSVTVPAGGCANVSILVDCESLAIGLPACAYYGIFINEVGNPQNRFECDGTVSSLDFPVKEDPTGNGTSPTDIPIGQSRTLTFDVENNSGAAQDFVYEIRDMEPIGGYDFFAITLDGLPPGSAVGGMIPTAPGMAEQFTVDVRFRDDAVPGIVENLYVQSDLDGDGVPELLASAIVRAIPNTASTCPGDGNCDGRVDILDLNSVIGNFGSAGESGDVNFDGNVDIADLNLVIGNFGTKCPPEPGLVQSNDGPARAGAQ